MLYNERFELLGLHAKAEPGRFRTSAQHIPREKVSMVKRGTDALLSAPRQCLCPIALGNVFA